ncbi:Tyrosine-protein kinase YwqD [Stieleria maiorica]|uniref:non-specific protein-tyrosine kinase n=1 Tax=Stieleria maiorica TaxID=2795974 RepID=A0A5B9MKX3_9BACT|nr:tyrosine-protein kinase domain-containing protein [Stieleria maiorica]QEF99567.1 Tyrosine-protein kinase YwqD [Stieleria maiorica]
MIAEQTSTPTSQRRSRQIAATGSTQPLDVLGALWRYRWAVILPAFLFGVVGFLVYLRTPETFRSSTRLMVESNRPPIFDALTGEVVGGVPDIEVLQAQLFSDTVATMAFNDPDMAPHREFYGNSIERFIVEVQEQLELEPEVTDVKTAQSLITLLHFDSGSTEQCEAAIKAYSKALQEYYDQRHQTAQADLTRLINVAMTSIGPKLSQLEQRYSEFRRDAPLTWDADGRAQNPHREQQQFLTKRRSSQYEELRREQEVLKSMEEVAKQTKDPRIALNVMSQLLGVKVSAVGDAREPDPLIGDSLLAEIDLEKKLLPLIVAKNQNVSQFGPSHPTVKALDQELETTREELLRLVREQADRITKLRREWFEDLGDPVERAKETVQAVVYSHRAKVAMLEGFIKELDEQIATEKVAAAEISRFELENEAMIREMEQYRQLMQQLEENLGKAKLSDDESVTQVVELMKPTKAYLVGPSILKLGGLGTLLGLMLGGGLALLLEKNANTFRDPEEICSMLGVAILTHIPFFRGKRRKTKKGEIDPYKTLSTDLTVVHQPASSAAEAIRALRTSVFFDTNNIDGGKVIQITSPLPGDGKSTIACNLACSIAQSGKRVLAIDCDLRRPQLTDNFDCDNKLGLTNVLNGECEPLDAAHATPLPKLSIMPCGPIPSNPAEALSLPVMNELLEVLREQYDYIILDTPPLLVVTDPSITASMADALILTLRIRRKSKPNAREALNILNGVGANVLGVVINNSDEANASDGYRGYGYYKYGRYGGYYRRNGQASGTSVAVTSNNSIRVSRSAPTNPAGGPSGKGAASGVKNGTASSRGAVASQGRPYSSGGSGTLLVDPPSQPAKPQSGGDPGGSQGASSVEPKFDD